MPERSTRRAVYIISVAAELSGMHPQTLRLWERRGLLEPERTQGGGRRYSEIDIQKLRRIQELTAMGLNLEGVRQVLALEAELAALKQQLLELVAENQRLTRLYKRELVPLKQFLNPLGD